MARKGPIENDSSPEIVTLIGIAAMVALGLIVQFKTSEFVNFSLWLGQQANNVLALFLAPVK